jgi:kynurenine formamidase
MLRKKGGVPAWASFSLNPQQSGNVYAIDGQETWLVHVYLKPGVTDFEAVDRDQAIRTVLGVDGSFAYDLLSKEDWIGRRLIVDRMRRDRVFICGDASHLWVPYAGYGMNAGIADAANLAWLLAARIAGWGADGILAAYEAERLPITEQVSRFAMNHAHAMTKARGAVSSQIDAEGPSADAYRASIAKSTYDLNVQQYCCAGLNFGYYYERSPLIVYDGEVAPPYSMGEFTASTAPGARVPHFTLADGRSLYDAFSHGYNLLRFDPTVDVTALMRAARIKGVPIDLLDIIPVSAPDVYRHKLILARPDQHVAWRGDQIPAEPEALINAIRGADTIRD